MENKFVNIEDDELAQIIVDALVDAKIIDKKDFADAVRIAHNEIRVRSALEQAYNETIKNREGRYGELNTSMVES